jgi:hypothetical protein
MTHVNHVTQSLQKEMIEGIENTQVDLETVKTSLDTPTKFLVESISDIRKGLHEEFGLIFQVEAQTTKALIEANQREFQSQLEEIEGRAERGSRPAAITVQPPTFDGTTSWAVFRRQFETVAEHNCWTQQGKYTYLITALQGRAADVLHGIPTSATYNETLQALEDRFGDHHVATVYRSQLKARTHRAGESLREFATAIEQLAYRAYPTLPEEHIRWEAGCEFVDGVEDTSIKIKLLLGGEKTVNEALRQALELQAVFLAARLQKTIANTFWGSRSLLTRKRKAKQSGCWSCGEPDHFKSNCRYGSKTVKDQRQRNKGRPRRNRWESPRRSEWRPSCHRETNRKGGQLSGNERRQAEMGRLQRVHQGPLQNERRTTSTVCVRRAGHVGAPATTVRRKRWRERIRKQDVCDLCGSVGTLVVSRSGRAPLRREQWEWLEYSRRRTDRATRRRHELETSGRKGGDTPLGYSGRTALRREQYDGFAQASLYDRPLGAF